MVNEAHLANEDLFFLVILYLTELIEVKILVKSKFKLYMFV